MTCRVPRAVLWALWVALCAPTATNAQLLGPTPTYEPGRSIIVGLPTQSISSRGQFDLRPNVNLVESDGRPAVMTPVPPQTPFTQASFGSAQPAPPDVPAIPSVPVLPEATAPFEAEVLPSPDGMQSNMPDMPPPGSGYAPAAPMFADLLKQGAAPPPHGLRNWLIARNIEPGVGRGRLAYAPFEIDSSAPLGNIRFRVNSFTNTPYPDRSELLWAKIGGRGPPRPEQGLDYQEVRTLMEFGSKKFSLGTEYPLRWTNPVVNDNHTGFGDMNLTTKTVMVDGDKWQITNLFRTYMPTGAPKAGMGTGHVSMEPGALVRYKWSDVTFVHMQMKYFFPLGGDPNQSGQVFIYGIGPSHVLVDGDNRAWIGTLEFTGSYIGNGQRTNPNGTISDAQGEHIMNLYPGIRYVRDCGGDLGIFEFGVCTGFPVSGPRFFSDLLRVELRWSF
jgi:hypothetical protein